MLVKLKQIWTVTKLNFLRWKRNPCVWMAFALGFVVSFLLSDKVIIFARDHETVLQILEPFIWTFGDNQSILTISLCLLLLFSDMPNLNKEVPFILIRLNRKTWMLAQIFYIVSATILFTCFILASTCVLSGRDAYLANFWSDTAAVLGYSVIGQEIAVPAFTKVLELSFPYLCAIHIFGLMTGYALFLSSIILYCNLWKAKGGMVGGAIFAVLGMLLTPEILANWLQIPQEQIQKANILFGWISPLNHATYVMHNFGYDNLPKLWVSYVFFLIGSVVLFCRALKKAATYQFDFTGMQ